MLWIQYCISKPKYYSTRLFLGQTDTIVLHEFRGSNQQGEKSINVRILCNTEIEENEVDYISLIS